MAKRLVGKINSPFIRSENAGSAEWAAKAELIKNQLRVDWTVSQREEETNSTHDELVRLQNDEGGEIRRRLPSESLRSCDYISRKVT